MHFFISVGELRSHVPRERANSRRVHRAQRLAGNPRVDDLVRPLISRVLCWRVENSSEHVARRAACGFTGGLTLLVRVPVRRVGGRELGR